MIGPRITTVFKSRWHALFWGAGVLLTAYCTVPPASDPGVGKATADAPAPHRNPWSRDRAD